MGSFMEKVVSNYDLFEVENMKTIESVNYLSSDYNQHSGCSLNELMNKAIRLKFLVRILLKFVFTVREYKKNVTYR